jgi:KDO2-lipid IV(A) lauroyltransferase
MADVNNKNWGKKMLAAAGNNAGRLLLRQASRAAAADIEGIACFIYAILTGVYPYRKKIIEKNGRIALGLEGQELVEFRKKAHRHFANLVAEILAGFTLTSKQMSDRMTFDMGTLFDDVKNDKNFLILPSHQGNWEWQMSGSALQFPFQILGVYQILSQKFFEDVIRENRSKGGAIPIPQRQIFKKLSEPGDGRPALVLLVADQAAAVENACVLPFLKTVTGFHMGPQVVASRYKSKAYYVSTLPGKFPHTYTSKIERLSDTNFMEDYVKCLERDIIASPDTYLWTHNRFKHTYTTSAKVREENTNTN